MSLSPKHRVVVLISGGKDSLFALYQCVQQGHEIVALGNLVPMVLEREKDKKEPDAAKNDLRTEGLNPLAFNNDSYMYQAVGHELIPLMAESLGIPLFRHPLQFKSKHTSLNYMLTKDDEVEDLMALLQTIRASNVDFTAVCSGAIESNYQRLRVEHVCTRLGVVSLAPLWKLEQHVLLDNMISSGMHAILVKTATLGLEQKHCGMSLEQARDHLFSLHNEFGVHVCGEGGEYESLTLDMPLFTKRIQVERASVVGETTSIAPVTYFRLHSFSLQDKSSPSTSNNPEANISGENKQVVQTKEVIQDMSGREERSRSAVGRINWALQKRLAALQAQKQLHHANSKRNRKLDFLTDSSSSSSDEESDEGEDEREKDETLPETTWVSKHFLFSVAAPQKVVRHQDKTVDLKQLDSSLAALRQSLSELGMTAHDNVVLVFFGVGDMACYGDYNRVYLQTFSSDQEQKHYPPARACVSLPFNDPLTQATVECLGVTTANGATRDGLWVQSISDWAPCCIGPYSQAAVVTVPLDTHLPIDDVSDSDVDDEEPPKSNARLCFLAGQIGIVPRTMMLSSDPEQQIALAFRNCGRVHDEVCGTDKSQSRVVQAVVFVVPALTQDPELVSLVRQLVSKHLSRRTVVVYAEVPTLPRNALVEVQYTSVRWPSVSHANSLRYARVESDHTVGGFTVTVEAHIQQPEKGLSFGVCHLSVADDASLARAPGRPMMHVVRALRDMGADATLSNLVYLRLWHRASVNAAHLHSTFYNELRAAYPSQKLPPVHLVPMLSLDLPDEKAVTLFSLQTMFCS